MYTVIVEIKGGYFTDVDDCELILGRSLCDKRETSVFPKDFSNLPTV